MYDFDLMRSVLKHFAYVDDSGTVTATDRTTLSPPRFENSEALPEHVDRLIAAGLLMTTHDITMRNHPDPVTLRATERGREWVRRAYSDSEWEQSLPAFKDLIDSDQ
jgi:hypothetical protein